MDNHYKVSQARVVPTSTADLINQLVKLVASYSGYGAIGIGVPGQVLGHAQVLKLAHIQKLKPLNLKKLLEHQFRVPVYVMNDAKAFALATYVVAQKQRFKSLAGVTLGTGIGVGVVIDGKIYEGRDGVAAEFGRLPMLDGKVLEQHIKNPGQLKSAKMIQKYLKLLVSEIVLSFNPEAIVLGGGWSKLPKLEQVAKQSVKDLTYKTKTKIIISKLKNAGIIGAALPLLKK